VHTACVNTSTRSRGSLLRVGLVILLLVGAFFVALPWLGCMMSVRPSLFAFPNLSVMLGPCTYLTFPVRNPNEALVIPGFSAPYWGNLTLGVVYLIAAVYVAVTRRSL
jgi:hypothetical protein